MRLSAVFGLLLLAWVAGTVTPATAQVIVHARMDDERTSFLLYERVDLIVTVTNNTESDLVLDNDGNHPWLSFMVCKQDTLPVRAERQAMFKPLPLKVGETKTLRVNLTPLYSFREEGSYTAQAVVDLPGAGDYVSQEVPFSVQRGRLIWSQQRPVDGSQRTYSLLRFAQKPDETELYLRVEDPADNIVYANVGLGQVEAFVDPQVYFDPQGNIHVMHLISMNTYLYTRADAQGKVVHQGVFKTFQEIPPRLRQMDDGSVFVAGGLEETPTTARESLSAAQRAARTPGSQPDGYAAAPATISQAPSDSSSPVSVPGGVQLQSPADLQGAQH